MSVEKIQQFSPILQQIAKAKSSKGRKNILKKCNRCIYYVISEIARNAVKGNIPLTVDHYNVLCRHKNNLRLLARKSKVPLKKRKYIINQRGGFLSALLIPALTVISKIIADKIVESK